MMDIITDRAPPPARAKVTHQWWYIYFSRRARCIGQEKVTDEPHKGPTAPEKLGGRRLGKTPRGGHVLFLPLKINENVNSNTFNKLALRNVLPKQGEGRS